MNKELIKQQIKELDKNNIISALEVIETEDYIEITTDLFEIYSNPYGIKYYFDNNCIYSERYEKNGYKQNNIKTMKDALDFLENNLDKINQIIKDNI